MTTGLSITFRAVEGAVGVVGAELHVTLLLLEQPVGYDEDGEDMKLQFAPVYSVS
jgi:hypothetical protein